MAGLPRPAGRSPGAPDAAAERRTRRARRRLAVLGGLVGVGGLLVVLAVRYAPPEDPAPPPVHKPAPPAPPPVLQSPAVTSRIDLGGRGTVSNIVIAGDRMLALHLGAGGLERPLVSLFDPQTGRRLGGTELVGERRIEHAALSPDGARAAVLERIGRPGAAAGPTLTVWDLPSFTPVVTRWAPYEPGDPAFLTHAERTPSAALFLDAGKLLTVTRGGRVDLWSLPDKEPVYQSRPVLPGVGDSALVDYFTFAPEWFALSPDRGTLALRDGDTYALVSTATGKVVRPLPRPPLGVRPQSKGVAFSPDGTRLAALWLSWPAGLPGPRLPDFHLVTWDVAAGRLTSVQPFHQTVWWGQAVSWWGPDHVIGWKGRVECMVFDPAGPAFVRQGLLPYHAVPAVPTGDGRLWYLSMSPTPDGTGALAGLDPPTALLRQEPAGLRGGLVRQWWFTSQGITGAADPGEVLPDIRKPVRPGPA